MADRAAKRAAVAPPRIAIVGGGFTGSLLAVHLLRRSNASLFLIERTQGIGKGLAYSTQNPGHRLNVRVANMSAFDDEPAHFLMWLWAKDYSDYPAASIPPSGHAFVLRRVYGAYIEDVLREAVDAHNGEERLTIVNQAAIDLAPGDAPEVMLADGTALPVDYVVLCIGNFPSAPLPRMSAEAVAAPRHIANPWDMARLRSIPPDDQVTIVGSGLTMVDIVESLAQNNHRGRIEIVSRHGLVPLRHEQTRPYPAFLDLENLPRTVPSLLRLTRAEIRRAAAVGFDWRSVIDALRPVTTPLWKGLPLVEKRRFLRHLRPYWEIHRHRVSPETHMTLARLIGIGQLRVRAGRIQRVAVTGERFDLSVRWRGHGAVETEKASWIVNCSGPQSDYAAIADPFVQNLHRRGAARRDALALGLAISESNALIDESGKASETLFALGPPTKGAYWEIIAVPDIRTACDRFAGALVERIEKRAS